MILFLKILGRLGAVALGIFLGAGRYTQPQPEIDVRPGGGSPRRARGHFMWLDLLRTSERGSNRGRPRALFQTAVARDKKDRD